MSRSELVKACRERSLPTSGSKDKLAVSASAVMVLRHADQALRTQCAEARLDKHFVEASVCNFKPNLAHS